MEYGHMQNLTGSKGELQHEAIFNFLENHSKLNVSSKISEGITSLNNIVYTIPVPVKTYLWTITISSVIGIVGNLLVLIVYIKNYREITPFKFLIIHLGFCDFLFSFAQIFEVAANGWYTHGTYTWMLNLKLCKFTRSSVHLGSLVSVGTILAITTERFLGTRQRILYSLRSNLWKKVLIAVGSIWIAAVCSDIPIFMSVEIVNDTCREQWKESFGENWNKSYSIFLLLAFCLIPMAAMMVMNGMIIYKVKKPGRLNRLYKNMLEEVVRLRKSKDMRAVKILVTIIIAFFVCILPTRIMWVVQCFFDLEITDTWSIFYNGYLSYPIHVAINPVIYSIIDTAFRKDLMKLLMCKDCKVTDIERSSLISRHNNNLTASCKPRGGGKAAATMKDDDLRVRRDTQETLI